MPLQSTISSRTNTRNRIQRLSENIIYGVDSRLTISLPPSASMSLYTGVSSNYSGSTYTPNLSNWASDLRSQLTGIHMYAGAYHQSYGLMPLGRNFCLNCGHNGPEPLGITIRYVKTDGSVFSTTLSNRVNDFGVVSGSPDLQIYCLADPIPNDIYIAPIIKLSSEERERLGNLNTPTVAISQGNWTSGPSSPYGYANTPNNRMLYVRSGLGGSALNSLRTPYTHGGYVGDSGTPEYLLINGVLYLYSVISGAIVADYIDNINDMIARSAALAGISPITVTSVDPPYGTF